MELRNDIHIERETLPRDDSQSEIVALGPWRIRLAARGLRGAHERMHDAIETHALDLDEAMRIAQTMDSAIDMLRRTIPLVADDSELHHIADEALAAFTLWRAAVPHSDESRRASERFATLVRDLEACAARGLSPKPG